MQIADLPFHYEDRQAADELLSIISGKNLAAGNIGKGMYLRCQDSCQADNVHGMRMHDFVRKIAYREERKMKLFGSKEPTEMDRVMKNIAQVEGEIQQKIFQLGQMYYSDHKSNDHGDEKYFPLIDLINRLDLNRRGFYKNKLRLEGQMMCLNCNAVIPYGSIYCNVCGKKTDEEQDGKTAAGLGMAGDGGAAAGMGVAGDGKTVAGTGMPGAGAADAAAVNAGERRCAGCGAVLEPDSMFCTSCGQKAEG